MCCPESNQVSYSCRQCFYVVYRNAFDAPVGGDSSASSLTAEAESRSSLLCFLSCSFLRLAAFSLLSESFIVCVFRGSFHLIERLKEDMQERNIDFSILSRRNSV